MPSPANCLADVERREQRVAIYCNKISAAPSSLDPFVRTSAQYEIETYVCETVRRDEGLYWSGSERLGASEQMMTHRYKGGYGTEAGQHPRLNSERDLRRGVSLELLSWGIPYEQIDHCIRA